MSTPAVLMNDFQRQWREVGSDVLHATQEVGESGWYILGSRVQNFEKNLSAYWGLRHAVGCASGLDALEIGLRVLGIQSGDRVLTTPLTAFATTLAILRCGGVPVYVDVDEHGLLDLLQAEKLLQRDTSIRFMVPVHLYGHALPLPALQKLKDKYRLSIVEDCAQAIGAKFDGKPVGSVGQIAATSFYPTKNLGALGDSGAILTNMPELFAKAIKLRDYGQSEKYLHSEFGLNSRLDELHAAILDSAMLPRLRGWTMRRRQLAKYYQENIKHPLVTLPTQPNGSESVWHLFPLKIQDKRDNLKHWLSERGIQSGVHYPILASDQPVLLKQIPSYKSDELLVAKAFTAQELSIPIHPHMTTEELDRVIDAVNQWDPDTHLHRSAEK